MGKTTNLPWMCVLVLGLAYSASGEYADDDWTGTLDIPGHGGEVQKYLDFSPLVPANAIVTSVTYNVAVDDQGNEANFWCSDYEIYVGNDTRGAWYHCIWDHEGAKTDAGADDDGADDSDIALLTTLDQQFDGDRVSQKWYVAVRDNRIHGFLGLGAGRLVRLEIRIYYHVPKPDLLVVASPWFAPDTVVAGEPGQALTMRWRIANAGDADVGPFTLSVYLEHTYHLCDRTINRLLAREEIMTDFLTYPLPLDVPPGRYGLLCVLDPDDHIDESNEHNNEYMSDGYLTVLARVPNVVGMSESQAVSAITSAGLVVGTKWYTESDTVPAGSVVSQDPAGGTTATYGSAVELTLSTGSSESPTIAVPNVVGMTQTAAQSAITSAGLVVGTVSSAPSDAAAPGEVLSQNPTARTFVPQGSAVDLVVCADAPPEEPAATDAVAHWKLDETDGMAANDSSGNANHGVLYGDPLWLPDAGMIDGALQFDGIDDCVSCGTFNPSAATGKLTICLWANWNGPNGQYQGLIGKRDSHTPQAMMWHIEADIHTGSLSFARAGGSGVAAAPLPIGEWAHVAAAFDGTTARLYLDGVQESSGAFSLGSGTGAQVVFGACEKNGGNPFNGALDDVRLHDQALSESQIQTLMVPPATIVWDRAAYWDSRYPSCWVHGTSVRDALSSAGYKILNADELKTWMDGHIADGAPSVVVFCQDIAPETVYEVASSSCTLRRYLNAGGKVVWYGDIPLYFQGHSDGTLKAMDVAGSINALGFNPAGGNWDSAEEVTLTDEGLAWGLTQTWTSLRLALGSGLRVLARDSSGQAAAWVKHFLPGDTYRGFVRFSDCDAVPDVMDVRCLAVYPMAPGATGPGSADLVAHWALDETAGRIAYDSVGGYDGFLVGGPIWQPSAGKTDGALDFDGSNDLVMTDFVLNPAAGPFSVFAWIRGGTPGGVIISQDGSQGGVDWLLADDPGGRLWTGLAGGTGRLASGLASAKVITDGNWHEVGYVWDGANRMLYVDDVLVASDTQPKLDECRGGLNIGAGKDLDAGTFWSGLIDDVRIYNRVVKP